MITLNIYTIEGMGEIRVIKAKNRNQAWNKFCHQYFGPLKPDPKLYTVRKHDR